MERVSIVLVPGISQVRSGQFQVLPYPSSYRNTICKYHSMSCLDCKLYIEARFGTLRVVFSCLEIESQNPCSQALLPPHLTRHSSQKQRTLNTLWKGEARTIRPFRIPRIVLHLEMLHLKGLHTSLHREIKS